LICIFCFTYNVKIALFEEKNQLKTSASPVKCYKN